MIKTKSFAFVVVMIAIILLVFGSRVTTIGSYSQLQLHHHI